MSHAVANDPFERAAETVDVALDVTKPSQPNEEVTPNIGPRAKPSKDPSEELCDGPCLGITQAPDVESVIHQVHAGKRMAAELPLDLRHQCVAHLTMQGFTTTDIAAALHMNERTVRRDRAAWRSQEAIAPSSELGDELLGEYQRYLHAGIQRLTRRANDKSEPPYVRLWAEEAITRMYQKFIATVHKLNYLNEGDARIRHQLDMDPVQQKRQLESQQARFAMANAIDPIAMLLGQSEIPKSMQTVKTKQSIGTPIHDKHAANEKANDTTASRT